MKLDRIDLKILDLLQRDATIPVARIADQVGLSQTPCWKRIQKHEEAGVIRARTALLSPDAFGLSLTAFVMVEADEHTADWRKAFLEAVGKLEPILPDLKEREQYRASGLTAGWLALALARAVGFRNVLVHQHAAVDDAIVIDALDRLDEFDRFVAGVSAWLVAQR